MTSARILLAAVASGLAACAHTPSQTLDLPDVRHAAPVQVVNSLEVPAGFDEHIVIILDRDSLEYAYQLARVNRYRGPLYYDPGHAYRRPFGRPTVSDDTTAATPSPATPGAASRPTGAGGRGRPGPSRARDVRH